VTLRVKKKNFSAARSSPCYFISFHFGFSLPINCKYSSTATLKMPPKKKKSSVLGIKKKEEGTFQLQLLLLLLLPRKWFTKSAAKETFDLVNVVSTGVVMLPISPSNMPPKRVHETAERNEALKISEDSHNFILDEIIRRERLEYDPSRVFVGDEDDEE
jgi:hypothetical protein